MSFERPNAEEELSGESLELYQSIVEEVTQDLVGKHVTLLDRITNQENLVRVKAFDGDPSFVFIKDPNSSHSELTSLAAVMNSPEMRIVIEKILKESKHSPSAKQAVRKKLFPYMSYSY